MATALAQLRLQPGKSHFYTTLLVAVPTMGQKQLRNLAFTFKREDDPPFAVDTSVGKKFFN